MDPETVKTVGTGIGSGIAGVLATFLAFKSKFRNIVYKDTFEAVINGFQKQLDTQTKLISDQGKDIKELLKK